MVQKSRETVPVSLKLVIKCQFSSCSDGLGGEEPNPKLAVNSPLKWDKKNYHQCNSAYRQGNLTKYYHSFLLPLYLLGLTVGLAAMVHKSRTVTLQRCIDDLESHKTMSSTLTRHRSKYQHYLQCVKSFLTSLFLRAMK